MKNSEKGGLSRDEQDARFVVRMLSIQIVLTQVLLIQQNISFIQSLRSVVVYRAAIISAANRIIDEIGPALIDLIAESRPIQEINVLSTDAESIANIDLASLDLNNQINEGIESAQQNRSWVDYNNQHRRSKSLDDIKPRGHHNL